MLEGKDVLIRARTGSGKTAAFAIPLIQKILLNKRAQKKQDIKGLIIAPSKELCKQIHDVIISLTIKCSREVNVVDVSPQVDLIAQKPLLNQKPDIIVGTPGRLLQHLKASNMKLKHCLETLIIDEADLVSCSIFLKYIGCTNNIIFLFQVFSFGYEDEIKSLLSYLPTVYQAALASATLSEDVLALKKLVLHRPVTLKLEEPPLAPLSQLSHYSLAAEENDKAAILYALLKLNLVR